MRLSTGENPDEQWRSSTAHQFWCLSNFSSLNSSRTQTLKYQDINICRLFRVLWAMLMLPGQRFRALSCNCWWNLTNFIFSVRAGQVTPVMWPAESIQPVFTTSLNTARRERLMLWAESSLVNSVYCYSQILQQLWCILLLPQHCLSQTNTGHCACVLYFPPHPSQ